MIRNIIIAAAYFIAFVAIVAGGTALAIHNFSNECHRDGGTIHFEGKMNSTQVCHY
jgi:hypothetical protein